MNIGHFHGSKPVKVAVFLCFSCFEKEMIFETLMGWV